MKVDNSGSMNFEQNGERMEDLRLILSRVVYTAALFDDDGISIRFMNDPYPDNKNGETHPLKGTLDHISSEQQADTLTRQVPFQGLTPIGTQLDEQIIKKIILGRPEPNKRPKPFLVIIITDGQPAGEERETLQNVLRHTIKTVVSNPRLGRGAVSFQFAQVGNDKGAQAFLSMLDNDKTIGDVIDCTSSTAFFLLV